MPSRRDMFITQVSMLADLLFKYKITDFNSDLFKPPFSMDMLYAKTYAELKTRHIDFRDFPTDEDKRNEQLIELMMKSFFDFKVLKIGEQTPEQVKEKLDKEKELKDEICKKIYNVIKIVTY